MIAPPPPTPKPVAPLVESTPVASTESNGRGLRIAGITAGAVGVAALGGGLAFNLMANKLAKDLNATGGYDQDKASTRSTYATLTWVGYGVGGACLVGGAILYYLGSRTPNRRQSLCFRPWPWPGRREPSGSFLMRSQLMRSLPSHGLFALLISVSLFGCLTKVDSQAGARGAQCESDKNCRNGFECVGTPKTCQPRGDGGRVADAVSGTSDGSQVSSDGRDAVSDGKTDLGSKPDTMSP